MLLLSSEASLSADERLDRVPAQEKAVGLSANWLKIIAIISMTIDHYASGFLPEGFTAWIVLRTLGRLSMPIMCFFIAEGYRHTSNLRRYALRLLLFALLSHLPFTFYFGLSPLRDTGAVWGLLMGLLALAVWKHRGMPLVARMVLIAVLALAAMPADWGYVSVFWVLCFGAPATKRMATQVFCFVLVGIVFYLLPVAGEVMREPDAFSRYCYRLGFVLPLPLLAAYRGVRGRRSALLKWGFYAYYPVHLVVLALLRGA